MTSGRPRAATMHADEVEISEVLVQRSAPLDLSGAAVDLADLLRALRSIDPAGGPPPGRPRRPASPALDWGAMCVGDPACDAKVAWAVLDAETRPVVRELLEIDDATWMRGRGWAVSQALIALPYYRHTYPVIVRQARRWLAEALADL
jgi:aminoglycoside phosphotransferase (APT) family kinase protein